LPELRTVPIDKIRVPDVRVSSILDQEQRAFLASTIKEVGVINEPTVRPLEDGSYELITGRSRISELAAHGLREIQVKVVEADSKTGLIMNIVENVARGSYDYVSISEAIRRLKELGTSMEELERIFPWKRRWIEFLEGLQDLPSDVVQALKARKVTPTHIQVALDLPTPEEVHSGLRTAINMGWDTGTFRIFVSNRVEQIERARKEAAERGVEPEIPEASPAELIRYKQCLLCGYQKEASKVVLELICQDCQDLIRYITTQEGPPEKAIDTIYQALRMYHGLPPDIRPGASAATPK